MACVANAQANGVRERQAYKEKVIEPVVRLEGGVGEDEENGERRDVAVTSEVILATAHTWYYTATIWSHTERQ